ncbi:MAG: MarR family winged helix-turn-helix transcriptional regulator [Acidimicrobiales bacterium]
MEFERLRETAAGVRQGTLRLAQRLRAERAAEALSLNKLSVLSHVYRHGPTSAGALAAAAHQRPQSLTRVFAELERDGLISRFRDETDRRHQVLELTSAGRAALVADMAERDAWLALALAELTETEREVLRLAGQLMDRLADAKPDVTIADGG